MAKARRVIKQGRTRQMPRRVHIESWDNTEAKLHSSLVGKADKHSALVSQLMRKGKPEHWNQKGLGSAFPFSWAVHFPPIPSLQNPFKKIYFSQENKVTEFSLQNFLSILYRNILVPEKNGVIFVEGVCYITCRCQKTQQRSHWGVRPKLCRKQTKGPLNPFQSMREEEQACTTGKGILWVLF